MIRIMMAKKKYEFNWIIFPSSTQPNMADGKLGGSSKLQDRGSSNPDPTPPLPQDAKNNRHHKDDRIQTKLSLSTGHPEG